MGGSKSTESEARKMTIYFDKRAEEESAKIAAAEEEEAQKQKIKQENLEKSAKVLSLFVKPLVLMLLWNWLMPGIFGLATIGYLKAFGLCLLSRILFGND